MSKSLTEQSKQLMDCADAMHDTLCAKYGERADVSMYALQCSVEAFLIYCTVEQLESNTEDK